MPNPVGTLAQSIIDNEYPDDTGSYPVSYVSGWLEANIGQLNALTHEFFYIGTTGDFLPSGLEAVEEHIFKELYTIHYYDKTARVVLRDYVYGNSAAAASSWISIKEGDTSIQRANPNSMSRSFKEFATEARERLDNLLFQYNMQKSSPLQVAGDEPTVVLDLN